MASVNEAIFHRTVQHHVRVQRYSLGAKGEFDQILADAYDQIRQAINDNAEAIDEQNTDSEKYTALIALIIGIWEDTKAALQDTMQTALTDFAENEVENEVATLTEEIPADVSLVVPSQDEIDSVVQDVAFQGRTLDTWLEDFKNADLSRIQAVIVGGMQAGRRASEIASELETTVFQTGFNMLGNLVRTVWNGVSNWVRKLVIGGNKDIIPQVMWTTVLDDVTSFPTGTPVTTPSGQVAIERLRVGDLVDTPQGPQPILAVRSYQTQRLIRLDVGELVFRATPDHEFMRFRNGSVEWTAACRLQPGDQLCKIAGDESLSAQTFYVGLSPTDHAPAVVVQKSGLSGVPLLVAVPVRAVDFEGDPVLWEQDIDAVASDLILLQERDAGGIQCLADASLQPVGAAVLSITGNTAKNTISGRNHPKSRATVFACPHEGRSSAFLATELAPTKVAVESLATATAGDNLGVFGSTFPGANGIAVDVAGVDGECLAASATHLLDLGASEIAGLTTKATGRQLRHVKSPSASLAGQNKFGPKSKATIRADFDTAESSHVKVYCLTVKSASAFFANGFLVHNCPICADLDGEIFDIEAVDPPPAHSSCRCVLTAVVASHNILALSKRHKKAMRYVKPADRATLTGKPPPRMRYATWLRSQPVAVQEEALGPKRARLFRIGKLELRRFVGNHKHILTLAELKQRDRAAWKRAGLD